MQLVFYVFAIIALYVLFVNYPKRDSIINLVLTILWIWMGLIYHLMYFSQINALAKVFGVMFIVQGLIFGYFGVINDKIQYRADTTISSAMDITLTRVFRRGMVVEEKEKVVMNPAAS